MSVSGIMRLKCTPLSVVTVSIIYTALPVFAIHALPETTEVDAPRKVDETKAGQRLRWVT